MLNAKITGIASFLPDDVLDIGPCAFKGCTSLKTIKLSFRLKTIGEYAFQDCRSLECIHLPINVETIGNGAFFGCEALNVINCDREDLLPPEHQAHGPSLVLGGALGHGDYFLPVSRVEPDRSIQAASRFVINMPSVVSMSCTSA